MHVSVGLSLSYCPEEPRLMGLIPCPKGSSAHKIQRHSGTSQGAPKGGHCRHAGPSRLCLGQPGDRGKKAVEDIAEYLGPGSHFLWLSWRRRHFILLSLLSNTKGWVARSASSRYTGSPELGRTQRPLLRFDVEELWLVSLPNLG